MPGRGTGAVARLYIGVGRSAGVRPKDLVGAIANETHLSGNEIGAITISDRFSIVEVPESAVEGSDLSDEAHQDQRQEDDRPPRPGQVTVPDGAAYEEGTRKTQFPVLKPRSQLRELMTLFTSLSGSRRNLIRGFFSRSLGHERLIVMRSTTSGHFFGRGGGSSAATSTFGRGYVAGQSTNRRLWFRE